MIWPKVSMPKAAPSSLSALLGDIRADYPAIQLVEGPQFSWHAERQCLAYKVAGKDSAQNIFSLLHELGHAVLNHKDYTYDIELLQLEVAAWEKARKLADQYGVELDEGYIQDCLDTYRDWLHLRATCPTCFARSLQASE